jgi:hypothetical protein
MGDGLAGPGPAACAAENRLVFNHISGCQPSSLDPAWKQMNLAGGGLQSANIRLARLLKRRRVAYALLLLFPVGAHRAYLEDRPGAVLYGLGSAAAVLSLASGATLVGAALGGSADRVVTLRRLADRRRRRPVQQAASSRGLHEPDSRGPGGLPGPLRRWRGERRGGPERDACAAILGTGRATARWCGAPRQRPAMKRSRSGNCGINPLPHPKAEG